MAKVQIKDIIDHLSSEMRRALEDTVKEKFPDQRFDAHDMFRTFKRMVGRKCSSWENVPDHLVEKEN